MYHLIEFKANFTDEQGLTVRERVERLLALKSKRAHVHLRPHVVETAQGPVEVADLYFQDGTVSHQVRFDQFRFID